MAHIFRLISYLHGPAHSIFHQHRDQIMVPECFHVQLGQPLEHEIPHHHCKITGLHAGYAARLSLPHLHTVCLQVPRSDVTLTCPAKSPQTPMMHRILNTAEPTMVPTPTSPLVMKTPETQTQRQPGCCGQLHSKVGLGELVRLFIGSTGNSQGLERAH